MQPGYALDNAHGATPVRFAALEEIFDPASIDNLALVPAQPGWDCLEVGAGGGSIAMWLSDKVAPRGKVVAIDIDTRFIDRLDRPNLEVRRHDIASDPLPRAAFDLVHCRLLLTMVPERMKALDNMVAALKPGGWFVAEECDSFSMPPDAAVCPTDTELETLTATRLAMELSGADLRFGRCLAGCLNDLGLIDIHASGHVSIWRGRSTAACLLEANIAQLRDVMVARKLVSLETLEKDLALLRDPATAFPSPVVWTVRARRAGN